MLVLQRWCPPVILVSTAAVVGGTAPAPAIAQVVRGTLTAAGAAVTMEAAPGRGVLATLVDASGATVARARVSDAGRYVLAAPSPGAYQVVLMRVGFQPVRSAALALARGDTTALALPAPAEAVRLRTVLVEARRQCAVRPEEGAPAAALWGAARSALEAAAAAESTVTLRVRRYARAYTPDAVRLTDERVGTEEVVRGAPFAALAADRLAARGYVRRDRRGAAEFLAPDARTLLSDAFAAGHCFEVGVVADTLVALDFEPVAGAGRRDGDVAGTLWLTPGTGALRALTFRYTNLPAGLAVAQAGGRLDFRQLDGGAWVVARWGIRAALLDRAPGSGPAIRPLGGRFGAVVPPPEPPRVVAIREVGGEVVGATDLLGAVTAEAPVGAPSVSAPAPRAVAARTVPAPLDPSSAGAAVVVIVRDSAGRPVPSATVRIEARAPGSTAAGADSARVDASGRLPLGRRAPGRYHLEVRALGFRPERFEVVVPPAGPARDSVTATLVLTRAVAVLADQRVTAERAAGPAYAARSATGLTLDRAAIEARRARTVSDLFSGLPGVQVIGGVVTVPRVGSGPLLNSDQPCTPVYYVDGARAAAAAQRGLLPSNSDPSARATIAAVPFGGAEIGGGVGGYFSPLLGFTPDDLERVTVYTSLHGVPPQYASSDATCGVVVVTTRRGSDRR